MTEAREWQFEQQHDGGGNPLPEWLILDLEKSEDIQGHVVATVYGKDYARLIAAAPKMLAALQAILREYGSGPGDDRERFGRFIDALYEAKHAIREATGGEYGPGHPSYIAPLADDLVELLRGREFDGKFDKKSGDTDIQRGES